MRKHMKQKATRTLSFENVKPLSDQPEPFTHLMILTSSYCAVAFISFMDRSYTNTYEDLWFRSR